MEAKGDYHGTEHSSFFTNDSIHRTGKSYLDITTDVPVSSHKSIRENHRNEEEGIFSHCMIVYDVIGAPVEPRIDRLRRKTSISTDCECCAISLKMFRKLPRIPFRVQIPNKRLFSLLLPRCAERYKVTSAQSIVVAL